MAQFFKDCNSIDIISVEELLLRKYNNIDYILQLELGEGIEFIHRAFDQELEDRLWQQWLVEIPLMTKDSYETFEDYKNARVKPRTQVEKRSSKEELLMKAEAIKEKITIRKEVNE